MVKSQGGKVGCTLHMASPPYRVVRMIVVVVVLPIPHGKHCQGLTPASTAQPLLGVVFPCAHQMGEVVQRYTGCMRGRLLLFASCLILAQQLSSPLFCPAVGVRERTTLPMTPREEPWTCAAVRGCQVSPPRAPSTEQKHPVQHWSKS